MIPKPQSESSHHRSSICASLIAQHALPKHHTTHFPSSFLWLLILLMPCLPVYPFRSFLGIPVLASGADRSASSRTCQPRAVVSPRWSAYETKNVPLFLRAAERGMEDDCGGTVANFRPARGLNNTIFRCGNTDNLIQRVELKDQDSWTVAEEVLLCHTGLLIDLRSPSERSSRKARGWMSMAPGGAFEVQKEMYEIREPHQERTNLRLDVLVPERFFRYLDENWLSPQQKAQAALFKLVDSASLHNMRMDALNERGLRGLNEAILETGKKEFAEALRAITLHLEYVRDSNSSRRCKQREQKKPVVINCVRGKDRTGLLVMLCQSVLNVSETDIVEDYSLSDDGASSADRGTAIPSVGTGTLNRNVFGGRAPKEVMVSTLQYVRAKYGSVSPGYLDSIGFDEGWRNRLKTVIGSEEPFKLRIMV